MAHFESWRGGLPFIPLIVAALAAGVISATAVAAADNGPATTVKLKPFVVTDPMINNSPALTLLVPENWKPKLQVVWTWDPFNRVTLAGSVTDENESNGMGFYGRFPFCAPNMMFREGGPSYLGKRILHRLSPEEYVRQVVIPTARRDLLQAKIVSSQPAPEYAKLLTADYTAKFGPGTLVDAVKICFEYPSNGKTMEENFYGAVTSSAAAPNLWNGDAISFRAEKGTLDQNMGLFLVIVGSVKIDPSWLCEVNRLNNQLIRNYANQSNNALALSQHLTENQNEISNMLQESYKTHTAALEESARGFSQAIRGVDSYQAGDGRSVELPNGWDHYLTNGQGEILLTRDVPYDQIPAGWNEMSRGK